MKKYFYIIAALSIAPFWAQAQSLDSEVDAELDQIAAKQQNVAPVQQQSVAPVTEQVVRPSQQAVMPSAQQPIYIVNQGAPADVAPQQQAVPVQKQPTTYIEASPLTESRAEQIRKARQDAEVQTEQKIVEKLETSRMEDEKRRANMLFGDKFQQMQEAPVQQAAAPVVVQQQPVAVQQVQAPVKIEENTRDIVREEIRSAMKVEEEVPATPLETHYFAAMAGIGDYPDVKNVTGNYSLGASFGTVYDSSMIVEGTFLFSNYSVNETVYANNYGYYSGYYKGTVDMNQYSGALAVKYQFLSGLIRPILGGLAQYTYRNYSWSQNGGYYNGDTATSHAIDVGVVTGFDLAFNQKFSLGLDVRYLWNMSNRTNTSTSSSTWVPGYQTGTPIEKLQYYTTSLVGRVAF